MIITRTPLRVSFLGGGTDYPDYYRQHGGQTLGVAIDKYSYVIVNKLVDLFDYSIRISYSRTELVKDISEIEHPSVRECLRHLEIPSGIEINIVTDLPARTGLGSSSSFTVGLLHALYALRGEMVSRGKLAERAAYVEQEMIRERVGTQDQYTCAHGGMVHLKFACDGSVNVLPIPLSAQRQIEFESHLMLFYTGIRRSAHDLLEEQMDRTNNGANSEHLVNLSGLVDEGIRILTSEQPIRGFGDVLHEAWTSKRQLSSRISTTAIDDWYDTARRAGAVGGKLLGAGGGGFMLLFVPPERHLAVAQALGNLRRVDFRFENSGSSIVFYHPGS
jgi:D-glycero-alpha-D-manno-heptose-7-phosphate kinase